MTRNLFSGLPVLAIVFFSISDLSAQKRNNTWVMYSDEGLNFNYSPPRHFYSGLSSQHNATLLEAVATISNPHTGNLLFYCSARTTYNAANQIMTDGDNLPGSTSCTQGAVIVPFPDDTNKYYLFVMNETGEGPQNLSYSVVDMTLDGGLGDIAPGQKAVTMDSFGLSEKMQAVTNSTCDGYWLLVHQLNTSCFLAYSITAAGISAPVSSCVGKVYDWGDGVYPYLGAGAMSISPNGKLLAVVHCDYGDSVYSELFDFDNATGVVSNQRIYWTGTSYGVAFSSDNTKIYTSSIRSANQPLPASATLNVWYLYQFDLLQGANNIDQTRFPVDSFTHIQGLGRGPDGKIYVSTLFPTVIESPNLTGTACNYNSAPIFVDSTHQYPDTSITENSDFPNYVIEVPGDTTLRGVTMDTSMCRGNEITLSDTTTGSYFIWSNGQSGNSISVSTGGEYSVTVSGQSCIITEDTFLVNLDSLPKLYLPTDTTLCAGDTWFINSGSFQMNVQWGTNSHEGDTFTIQTPATYFVTLANSTCQSNDTVSVSFISGSGLALPKDTDICGTPLQFILEAKNETVIWNGTSSGNSYTINEAGLYQVDITGPCGHFSDSINVTSCATAVYVPNAFAPGSNGANNSFCVYGNTIKTVQLLVFNRWGEKVFEGENLNAGWDGTYKGKEQEPGVYVYMAMITFLNNSEIQKKGSLTLIR